MGTAGSKNKEKTNGGCFSHSLEAYDSDDGDKSAACRGDHSVRGACWRSVMS